MLHNLTLAEVSLVALLALPLDFSINPKVHLAQSIEIFIVGSHPSFLRITYVGVSSPNSHGTIDVLDGHVLLVLE